MSTDANHTGENDGDPSVLAGATRGVADERAAGRRSPRPRV
jgi:hypothetical protein